MVTSSAVREVIVVGGGPAGATAALELARRGLDVLLLEAEAFPRFHIGESFLPRSLDQIRDLGLGEALEALPRMPKPGAEFLMGHGQDPSSYAWFAEAMGTSTQAAFNIERAPFDDMLLTAAREAGADVQQGRVRRILELRDKAVTLEIQDESGQRLVRGRYLVDATGQSTLVGRHLGIRRVLADLRKVAYYGHFQGVQREAGDRAGLLTIVLCEEGWFWLIPITEKVTSVGLVLEESASHRIDIPARQLLRWTIERCPVLRERCSNATFPEENGVTADFSYTCEPFAGPGYFMVGDSGAFLDPIFSTGVCMGMMGAVETAGHLEAILRRGESPTRHQRRYCRYVHNSSKTLFRLVRSFYQPSFRDLFLAEKGPLEVHRAVLGVLAGNVFPKPAFPLRWRLGLFYLFMAIQRIHPLTPRRQSFSLLEPNSL